MLIPFVILFFCVIHTRAFSPISSLSDCPKITPDNNFKLDKVMGTWRLAYLYIDDVDDLEEDSSCGVVEVMQVNQTNMEILLYIDSRKDEATLDRYTKEFDITVRAPGEWIIRTSFKYLEFIHVTVVGFLGDHLILTFCATPFNPDNSENSSEGERNSDYHPISNQVEKDSINDIFKASDFSKASDNLNEVNKKTDENRHLRNREESFFRGKRYALEGHHETYQDSAYQRFFDKPFSKSPKKHLWTAILVRNNKVSALEYIENASYLIKYGFNISKGQLVGFGRCRMSK